MLACFAIKTASKSIVGGLIIIVTIIIMISLIVDVITIIAQNPILIIKAPILQHRSISLLSCAGLVGLPAYSNYQLHRNGGTNPAGKRGSCLCVIFSGSFP